MGFLDFLKGKDAPVEQPEAVVFPADLGSPVKGTFVPMGQIPDEVFSTGVLGVCCGIDPENGNIYAPVSGTISQLAETLHAVGLEAGGIEVLIHVGVDTVEMNGDGFRAGVKVGQTVKKGDLLLTVDLEKVKAAGHPTTVILAVTNSDDFASVEPAASGVVQPGAAVLNVSK